jgi:hypothetical protein
MDALSTAGSIAATMALTSLIEALIMSRRKKSARRSESTGELLLDYSKALKGFAVFGVGVYFFFFAMSMMADWPTLTAYVVMAVAMTLTIGLAAFALLIESSCVEYGISRKGIRKKSPWSRDFFCPWSEIESIAFSASSQWFVIKSKEGKMRLHMYLSGLEDFAKTVMENVPPEKWAGAASQIDMLSYRAEPLMTM